jgi:hypothetical protein
VMVGQVNHHLDGGRRSRGWSSLGGYPLARRYSERTVPPRNSPRLPLTGTAGPP